MQVFGFLFWHYLEINQQCIHPQKWKRIHLQRVCLGNVKKKITKIFLQKNAKYKGNQILVDQDFI